jgi:hypothetical protein
LAAGHLSSAGCKPTAVCYHRLLGSHVGRRQIGVWAALRDYEEIARELDEVAELLLRHPELNHHAAEKLQAIARDIRSDTARLAGPKSSTGGAG